jgi:hypothetical protein
MSHPPDPGVADIGGVDLKSEPPRHPLVSAEIAAHFRWRWDETHDKFANDPASAVAAADELVASLIQHLTDTFAHERERLEARWAQGERAAIEDLDLARRRYQSFFGRLLSG